MSEKRVYRKRSKCPIPLQGNMNRAMKENLVAEEPKLPPRCGGCLAVNVDILGSTGNKYKVTLDRVPKCTCPFFERKEDICKHIFFVLLKVVCLPRSSPTLYQRAYLTNELIEISEHLKSSLHSGASMVVASGVIQAPKETRRGCSYCNEPIKGGSGGIIHCPSCRCDGVFHTNCLVLPDVGGLTIAKSKKKVRTTHLECPLCHTTFDHDEGYDNIAHVTGQSRIRDTSTYRPCPGYY